MQAATKDTTATQPNPMERNAPKVRPLTDLKLIFVFTLAAGFLIAYTLTPSLLYAVPLMLAAGIAGIGKNKYEIPYLWSGVAIPAYTVLLGVSLIWIRWNYGVLYWGFGLYAIAISAVSFVAHTRRLLYHDWHRKNEPEGW